MAYLIVKGPDHHWFIIPEHKEKEFNEWRDSEDALFGDDPGYAQMIDAPRQIRITSWEMR
jgi:hypothetical protein